MVNNIKQLREQAIKRLERLLESNKEESTDNSIDNIVRIIQKLGERPKDKKAYTGIFSKGKTLEEYRSIALSIIKNKLVSDKFEKGDEEIDRLIRELSGLPNRPIEYEPYVRLFNVEGEKKDVRKILTIECFRKIAFQASPSRVEILYPYIVETLERYEINTKLRICHYLAQVLHESGCLRYLEEIANGSAYEGRKDLGNTEPGYGRKYKGYGLIQVTGYYNFCLVSKALRKDFINNPKLLGEPRWAALSSGWYWDRKKLNILADKDDIKSITKIVNGGLNGYIERRNWLERAKGYLNVE